MWVPYGHYCSYPKTKLKDDKLLVSLKEENESDNNLSIDFKEELDYDSESSKFDEGKESKLWLEEIKNYSLRQL